MRRALASSLLCIAAGCAAPRPADFVAGEWITLDDNAAWCWFQDPRALIDGHLLLAGSIADDHGVDGRARKGDVDLSVLDLDAHTVERVVLHRALEDDDHDAPALLRLPDGRYLAAFSRHGADRLMRWRISTAPGDPLHWGEEQQLDVGAPCTYHNLFLLGAESGRIHDFHRGLGFDPNDALSDDGGRSFRHGSRLLTWDPLSDRGLGGGGRPYLRYASNGVDAIHFITTEDHPRNFDNGIWHGVVKDGAVLDSFGHRIARLGERAISPTDLTPVFHGDPDRVAWTVDLELDAQGLPVAVFSVQRGDAAVAGDANAGGEHLEYHYARFDGTRWTVSFLAHAGSRLYAPEVDYSGLCAIDPDHVDDVYLSTNADPRDGEPLISSADGRRHHEIYRAHTDDRGRTWSFTAITANSSEDNLRPNLPRRDGGRTALLWLRGTYHTYRDFETRLVGIVMAQD
ncbi:MAG: BNR-4 repeat-containing protein [Planctomycetota bacterium]